MGGSLKLGASPARPLLSYQSSKINYLTSPIHSLTEDHELATSPRSAMRRCTTSCTRNFREAGLNSHPRRWISYDKSALTKEALLLEAESGLGYHANGRPIKINAEAKTVKTAAGELPISPIMDPAWMRARRRPKKREATKPLGRFRRKLANNPFGR